MAYADIYNTANDAAIFQPRCFVASWLVAQDILSDPNAPQVRKDWAAKVVNGQTMNLKGAQLAMQVLRNAVVQTKLNNSTDPEILTAFLERLDAVVALG